MVTALCRFLARAGAQLVSGLEGVERAVALDRPWDLEAGEPRSPTSSRISPSIGTMTFVANRQLSPVLAPAG